MKMLILGASGMLGHELWRYFHRRHETWITVRRPRDSFACYNLFDTPYIHEGIDASDPAAVEHIVRTVQPDVVLNCVGIIKQLKQSKAAIPCITINALLPHWLAEACAEIGARLILFSTDCVFSGRKGGYREDDIADAEDLYGRTKFLGEVGDRSDTVTLRTSIIGRELGTSHSLVDWFLAQRGTKVRGFRRAIFTGFTTIELARIVERVLSRPQLHGLWNVASAPISKHDLLCLLRDQLDLDIGIDPYDEFHCDRSLVGDRFNAAAEYAPPEWPAMIAELADRIRQEIL